MYEVLILSKKNTDELLIAEKLSANKKLDIKIAHNAIEASERIKEKPFDLVIFNIKKFDDQKLVIAKNLRSLGHYFPVMALAQEVDFSTLLKVESLPNTVLLEKPLNDKDLLGLSQKLVEGKEVYQQIYRRYPTNQIANVEVYPTGVSLNSHIFNLSQGGAYIEVPQEASFDKGDMIKLDVNLRQLNRRHGVHAKVVWVDKTAIWNKGQALGIEFIKPDEIYAEMLANL